MYILFTSKGYDKEKPVMVSESLAALQNLAGDLSETRSWTVGGDTPQTVRTSDNGYLTIRKVPELPKTE